LKRDEVESPSLSKSIRCGGDFGKSISGTGAKADAARNVRKNGNGILFVQDFTPQRQYGSRLTNQSLLFRRNNEKTNSDQFNRNQNPGEVSLWKQCVSLSVKNIKNISKSSILHFFLKDLIQKNRMKKDLKIG